MGLVFLYFFQRKWLGNRPAGRGSKKVASLSLEQHRPGSLPVRFQLYHAIGCRFASDLSTLHFVLVTACTFQFVGPVFIDFFQNFPNFRFRS